MGLIDKIKEIRNKRNERIDAIKRVESKLKSTEQHNQKEKTDKEAGELAKKTGVSYKDALVYVENKRKRERTKQALKNTAQSIVSAGHQSRQNIERSGMFGSSGKGKHESMLDFSRAGGESIFGGGRGGGGGESFLDIGRVKNESIFGGGGGKRQKRHKKQKDGKKSGKKQIVINI